MQENDVEPRWRRASRCGSNACVEVADLGGSYGLRDSKDPEGPVLTIDRLDFRTFITGVTSDLLR